MRSTHLGGIARALRLRTKLTQDEVGRRAGLSRSLVSRLERGIGDRLAMADVDAIFAALGARLDIRVHWNGPELDRLFDAAHAALQAAVKLQLERWGWDVRVEVSYSRYGERGRIDLLAWHPATRTLLVVEVKTQLVDVQALLGSLDAKSRLAKYVVADFGWRPVAVVPAIVFSEDRTARRRVAAVGPLFERYALRGRACLGWLRRPGGSGRTHPTGLLWFTSRSNARVVRISGQRVRSGRLSRPTASVNAHGPGRSTAPRSR